MSNLNGFRVAVIATDGFEEQELTEPVGGAQGRRSQSDRPFAQIG